MKISIALLIALLFINQSLSEPNKAMKRLLNQGASFVKCQKKTGKLGRVAEMIYSNNDQPVTIKSKQSFAELDLDYLKLYVDEFKTEIYKTVKLMQIDKITIPISFQQPGYEVNCFQITVDKYHKGKIILDTEKEEPYSIADSEMTLCFRDKKSEEEWRNAIIDFYQNCGVKRSNMVEENKVEQQPETLLQVENKIKKLMDTAFALSKEFEVIKRQREYQDKLQKEGEEKEAQYQKEKKEKFEKVRKQTVIDNLEYGTAKDCDQTEEEKEDAETESEKLKLAEIKDESEIDMSDIDSNNELSEEEKQKKKEKRIALFNKMQKEKEGQRLSKSKQTEENTKDIKEANNVDLEPIKQLLTKLINMKKDKKSL